MVKIVLDQEEYKSKVIMSGTGEVRKSERRRIKSTINSEVKKSYIIL